LTCKPSVGRGVVMRNIVSICVLLSFLAGCFATQEDVAVLNSRVSNLESSVAKLEVTPKKIDSIDARLKSIEGKLQALDLLKGNYKSIEDTVNGLREDVYKMRGDIDSVYTELDLLKQRLSALENALLNIGESIKKLPQANGTKSNLIDEAEKTAASGNYTGAIAIYEKYITDNPKDPKIADYSYRLAELYFIAGRYKEAIIRFEDYRARYPDHSKIPASYLKEAIAFEKIGDRKSRDILLKMLMDKYPNSKEAQEAKKILGMKK